MESPKIKLKTMWMIDKCFESNIPERSMISHGIWMTNGLEFKDNKNIFTMVCISSSHSKRKIGDSIRMLESHLISMCHEVKLVDQPKLEL